MLPFRDENPTRNFPVVTVTLIAVNVLVFLYMLTLDGRGTLDAFVNRTGLTPGYLLSGKAPADVPQPVWLTIFTSMFLHGGWLHLGGNMLYLWIFGNNVEDIMGPWRFLLFYLICGVAAALAQVGIVAYGVNAHTIDPKELQIVMLGASGAIAGVLGAYLVRFPTARVQTCLFIFFFVTIIRLPAIVVLGFWFLLQLVSGTASLISNSSTGGGVAFWAHIGGFLAGMLLVFLFTKPRRARYNSWE